MPFFNKSLSSAHKKQKRYRNLYLKKRFERNETLKQQNYCVSLLKKTKKKHYANLSYKRYC